MAVKWSVANVIEASKVSFFYFCESLRMQFLHIIFERYQSLYLTPSNVMKSSLMQGGPVNGYPIWQKLEKAKVYFFNQYVTNV